MAISAVDSILVCHSGFFSEFRRTSFFFLFSFTLSLQGESHRFLAGEGDSDEGGTRSRDYVSKTSESNKMEGRCERLRQRQEWTAPFASSSSAKMSLRSLVVYYPQIPKGHLFRHVTRRSRIIITEKMPRRIKESKKRLREIFNCFGEGFGEGGTGLERGPILLFKAARCPRVTDGAAMRGHHLQKKRRRPLVRRRRRFVFFYLFSVSYAQEDYPVRGRNKQEPPPFTMRR